MPPINNNKGKEVARERKREEIRERDDPAVKGIIEPGEQEGREYTACRLISLRSENDRDGV